MGILQPTAKQVAERAGVSLRGVFRHFEHLDQLLLELDKREHARLAASIRPCPTDAPTTKRVDSFLGACARVYEGTATVRRALLRYEATSETLERHRERQRLHGHKKIIALFEHELDALPPAARRERVQEVSALTSWSQWEELRRYEGLSAPRTRRVLAREMRALLAPETD